MALAGSGSIDIEGERVELDDETFVRVAAGTKRKVDAGARRPDDARDRRLPGSAVQDRADERAGRGERLTAGHEENARRLENAGGGVTRTPDLLYTALYMATATRPRYT